MLLGNNRVFLTSIICAMSVLFVVFFAAGCSNIGNGNQITASTSRPVAAVTSESTMRTESPEKAAETEQATASAKLTTEPTATPMQAGEFMLKLASTTPQIQEIKGLDNSWQLQEDDSGALHIVCQNNHHTLLHSTLDPSGVWSAADTVAEDVWGYSTLLSPDGSLCIVYLADHRIHLATLKDGIFDKKPVALFQKAGVDISVDSLHSVFFDRQGSAHYIYYSNVPDGCFLDGIQISQQYDPILPGLGGVGTVIADDRGAWHMIAFSADQENCSILHSISTDSGATWAGPFTVAEGLKEPSIMSCGQGTDEKFHVAVNNADLSFGLLLYSFELDKPTAVSCSQYFDRQKAMVQGQQAGANDIWFTKFTSVDMAQAGKMILTATTQMANYLVIAEPNGEWNFTKIVSPVDSCPSLVRLSNGNLIIIGYIGGKLSYGLVSGQ